MLGSRRILTLALLLGQAALEGCKNGPVNPGPPFIPDPPSPAVVDSVAAACTASIDAALESIESGFSLPLKPASTAWARQLPPSFRCLVAGDTTCLIVGGDRSDPDHDGIPTDLVITADCRGTEDSTEVALTGSIRLQDPGASLGWILTYSDLRLYVRSGSEFADLRANGVQSVTVTASSLAATDNVGVRYELRTRTASMLVEKAPNWTLHFEAAPGRSITLGQPLPDGDLTVDGSYRYRLDQEEWSWSVRTLAPLAYDAECWRDPRFVSGSLELSIGHDRGAYAIRVDFLGCGKPPKRTFRGPTA